MLSAPSALSPGFWFVVLLTAHISSVDLSIGKSVVEGGSVQILVLINNVCLVIEYIVC